MQVVAFKIILKEVFSENKLLKGGWQLEKQGILYTKIKGKFKYSYSIMRIGKISLARIECILDSGCSIKQYSMLKEFDFEEAWYTLWGGSFVPGSVEILMRYNIFNELIDIGFKPAVMGVIEYKQEAPGVSYDISYYYPAPEHESLYKIIDDNPMDCMDFVNKLKSLKIIKSRASTVNNNFVKAKLDTQQNNIEKLTLNISSAEVIDEDDYIEVMTLKQFKEESFPELERYYPEYIPDNTLGIVHIENDTDCITFKIINYKGKIFEE